MAGALQATTQSIRLRKKESRFIGTEITYLKRTKVGADSRRHLIIATCDGGVSADLPTR
jgi:hypothetical protein